LEVSWNMGISYMACIYFFSGEMKNLII